MKESRLRIFSFLSSLSKAAVYNAWEVCSYSSQGGSSKFKQNELVQAPINSNF